MKDIRPYSRKERFVFIQTVATVGLLIVAIITVCYGISQYESFKSEKRPFIGLIRIVVESNLIKNYPIINPSIGKNVKPQEIINAGKKKQDQVEEIIIDLIYKNTGPLSAKDIDIQSVVYESDLYDKEGKKNLKPIFNDKTNFRKELDDFKNKFQLQKEQTNLVSLLPEQEKGDFLMIHKKEFEKLNIMRDDSTTTNCLYLVCLIKYKSTKDEMYEYFCVYKIYHPPAYTRIYRADLIKSETK